MVNKAASIYWLCDNTVFSLGFTLCHLILTRRKSMVIYEEKDKAEVMCPTVGRGGQASSSGLRTRTWLILFTNARSSAKLSSCIYIFHHFKDRFSQRMFMGESG